jgi:tryptophanyl-tRNA synthetase
LHKHFSKDILPDLERRYREGGIGYKESKELLAERVTAFVRPLRERRANLAETAGLVQTVLSEGAERARAVAQQKMAEVRRNVGASL